MEDDDERHHPAVPRGSNWPDNLGGSLADGLPRPATIGIQRRPKKR